MIGNILQDPDFLLYVLQKIRLLELEIVMEVLNTKQENEGLFYFLQICNLLVTKRGKCNIFIFLSTSFE